MSQSAAFANYSNLSRSLQEEAGLGQQKSSTFTDNLNDAANFEQQFLIGMAVHQKAKVGEQVAKLFKGSKKLQRATGLSEEDLGDIADGDFSGITGKIAKATSKKLQQTVQKVRDLKSQNLSDLADLEAKKVSARMKKNVSDELNKRRDKANQDLEDAKQASTDADAEVERLAGKTIEDNTADLDDIAQKARTAADAGADDGGIDELTKTASGLRDAANADKAAADLAQSKADSTLPTRPTAESTADDVRLEPNPEYDDASEAARNAKSVADESESKASEAEQQVNEARQATQESQAALDDTASQAEAAAAEARTSITAARNVLAGQQATAARVAQNAKASLATKTADAEQAQSDSEAAATEASDAADAVASGEGAVESGVASVASEGEKVAGIVSKIKDVDTAAAASEGFDPFGFAIAAIGAIAATLIGRSVKTHQVTAASLPVIASSYGSTLGA